MKMFDEFVNESERAILKEYQVRFLNACCESGATWKLNGNFVDISGNFFIDAYFMSPHEYIPVQLGTVHGNFKFCDTFLKTLKNCPHTVNGSFWCNNNRFLKSLNHCPIHVKYDFECSDNSSLDSLKGCPAHIHGNFTCDGNMLMTDLEGGPKIVDGDCKVQYCYNLKSFKGSPDEVKKKFIAGSNENLETLAYGPRKVGDLNVINYMNKISEDELRLSTDDLVAWWSIGSVIPAKLVKKWIASGEPIEKFMNDHKGAIKLNKYDI